MPEPLELPAAQRQALGRAALDWCLEYFSSIEKLPVYPAVSASDLRTRLGGRLPDDGEDVGAVMREFVDIAASVRHNGHPRMFGYVQSSGNFAAVIGDFLASALNQNVTSWRSAPSATTIELVVVDWIKQLARCDGFGGGVLLGGGSAANAAALSVALRASTDAAIDADGLRALPGPPVVYASDRVHMSVPKAAGLLGLGRRAVRTIPTDADGRMEPGALAEAIASDRAAGRHPVCVVANAGEVNTGAIDPLDAIADVCAATGVWLHVDGAYGGFAASVPRLAGAFAGLDRADSVALDPHKWLFAPLDAGCLLVRDEAHLRRAFSHGASYVDVVADRDMSDFAFWDVSPELSRRFRALKLWFAFKCHGAAAFVEVIDRNVSLAQRLAAAVDASDDFERLAPVPLSIVCFRHVPPALRGDDRALDDANRRLMVALQRDGSSYLSNAVVNGAFALRACIVNHRTREADVERLLADVRRVASGGGEAAG